MVSGEARPVRASEKITGLGTPSAKRRALPWRSPKKEFYTSDNNTVDIGGMPPGEHKVTITLVDATHQPYPGQSKTVKFTIPQGASQPH